MLRYKQTLHQVPPPRQQKPHGEQLKHRLLTDFQLQDQDSWSFFPSWFNFLSCKSLWCLQIQLPAPNMRSRPAISYKRLRLKWVSTYLIHNISQIQTDRVQEGRRLQSHGFQLLFGVGIVMLVLASNTKKDTMEVRTGLLLLAQGCLHTSELWNLRHPGESRRCLPAGRGKEWGGTLGTSWPGLLSLRQRAASASSSALPPGPSSRTKLFQTLEAQEQVLGRWEIPPYTPWTILFFASIFYFLLIPKSFSYSFLNNICI